MAHWGDVTEKARELAKREREIYQQQTIPAVLEEMAAEIERLRAERDAIEAERRRAVGEAERLKHYQANYIKAEEEIFALRAELADLIHDHSRAQSALSEFATENENLLKEKNMFRDACAKASGAHIMSEKKMKALEADLQAAVHAAICSLTKEQFLQLKKAYGKSS